MVDFDFSEIDKLAADLGNVPAVAGKHLRRAIETTARTVKDNANASIRGASEAWFRPLAGGIDYEVTADAGVAASSMTAEIGYNKARYGDRVRLANLREFGAPGSTNRLGPHNDLQHSLQFEQENFVRDVSDALADAEGEALADASVRGSAAAVIRGSWQ